MSKISVFNFITLNGFYKGPDGDISWHKHGNNEEERQFAIENMKSKSILLFGRVTYEMMASAWTSPEMIKAIPEMANGMNNAQKIVFSRTLKKVDWNNTTLIQDNIIEEMKKRKQQAVKDMTILGSGSIVTQFAEHGLIDTYMFMVDPIAIGDGTPVFHKIGKQLNLKLTDIRKFKSGVVLLSYQN